MRATVDGVTVDVDYTFESWADPYGTGDSPREYYIDIEHVWAGGVDVLPLLRELVIEELRAACGENERLADI